MVILELEEETKNWEDSWVRRSIQALHDEQPYLVNDAANNQFDFDQEYERQYRCRIIYRDEMKSALNACIVWEDRDFTYFKIRCP